MRHKCPAFERARNRATSALETAKAARAWAWATTVSPCNSLQIAEDYPYSALEIYSFDSNGNCPDAQFVSIALKARFKEQFRSCRVGPVHREEIVQSEYYFHPELGYACPAPRLRRRSRSSTPWTLSSRCTRSRGSSSWRRRSRRWALRPNSPAICFGSAGWWERAARLTYAGRSAGRWRRTHSRSR
jgi:hypothetical protein